MSLIQADHLSFSYPGSPDFVFQDVSFQIDTSWKLGLIGRNGRGKTTFLRLLQGEYLPNSGTLLAPGPFNYFPTPVPDPERLTAEILEDLCPEAETWQIQRELALLNTAEDLLWRPFSTLSNGERTKALLSVLFLRESCFPLIDEPTNHLDAQGRESVAAYLRKKRSFLLVSHDRRFLDGCTDHILALNRADIQVQAGNYSSWKENFDRQQQFEEAKDERLRKDIRRLRQAARRAGVWSDRIEASKIGAADKGDVGHQAAKMMKLSKTLEARHEKALEEKQVLLKNRETAESLKLSPLTHHAKTLVRCEELTLYYGSRQVCGPLRFTVEEGERVVLASGLKISCVPQDTSHLKGTLADFIQERGLDESLFKAILRKLGFERTQFERNLEEGSSGQKKKILLAGSLCERAHLYVWNEPLNFMDIDARTQIEELLLRFHPTLLFVEHDRAFQSAIATKQVLL